MSQPPPKEGRSEVLQITISYRLAALTLDQKLRFEISNGAVTVDDGTGGG